MRPNRPFCNPYGLRAHFAVSLVISALLCGLLFCVLNFTSDYLIENFFEGSRFEQYHIRKQGEDLQDFIESNHISGQDTVLLKKWEKRQPVILLELYRDGKCIYSSFHEDPENEYAVELPEERENIITVRLADGEATAVLYSDFIYRYDLLATAISAVLSLILFVLLFLHDNRRLIRYICRLNEEVHILEGGNLEYRVSEEGNDEITDLARSMNRMRESLQQQMETEQRLHAASRRLVTEMSHDLRTPLTGIMLYLEILRSRRYSSDAELQDYLEKIDAKAHHLKLMSDHLFEYSLQESPEKQAEPMGMEQAFSAAAGSLCDDLAAQGFSVTAELRWEPCFVQIDAEYVRRIFENITSNLVKYAEPAAEIRIETIYSGRYCGFSVLNTCAPEERQIESTGIGIESVRSMMDKMHGICTVEQTDTVYEITILFPKQ